MGDGKIIYEQAGHLHIYDIKNANGKKLTIGIPADLPFVRSRYVKGSNYIRSISISPTGARAVFEMRGEIITIPAEKGDPRNLTITTGANERSPVWSPDGQSIAYFSDESGEYELHIKKQDGKGELKKYKLSGAGFYEFTIWSPDNQKISFRDNSLTLYWLDIKTGNIKKIGSEHLYGVARTLRGNWSPDSKWIVYTLNTTNYIQKVFLYSLDQDKSYPITDGMSEVSEPIFDKSGKYLYFFASTDAGPVKQWFDLSNVDMRLTNSIYVVVLKKDFPSPLLKESDEEKPSDKKEGEKKEDKKDDKKDKKIEGEKPPKEVTVSVDFDGINFRILALPISTGNYSRLQAGNENEFYYVESVQGSDRKLHKYDLKKRKDEVVLERVNEYEISFDRSKILYSQGSNYYITSIAVKIESGKGKLNLEAVDIFVDPIKEWKQIFDEAWRINRDYFYDPNMHGANWKAMKEKYSAFLPYLTCRNDLNRVIQWMCSELSVGHHRVGGGDNFIEVKNVPVGLLGADYTLENGRYRFKKVYGGLNWNPELRSPLTDPGSDVKEGEYLLAVNGKDLRSNMNIFSLFENTSEKIVEITIGPNPDGSGARTVNVVPIDNEYALRNRDWVEGNIKKVNDATNGRVAYVYLPNTSTLGHAYFKRYFFPQADKDAIIVDERFNGGGSLADYYIDILKRQFISYWAMRYGEDYKTPGASILGPKVLIIDETAGSGGDLFPWMWRKFKLGPIVGKRTWGGLVGMLGFPVLMDGGFITAPNLAIWSEEGWVVENEGVLPDIEVEQLPAEVIKGKDPQLEKAIQIVMEELKKNPPQKMKRPPYPVRVRK
jgi:tricorn protease